MKYIPVITHISKEDAAFEVVILCEKDNSEVVGFGSVILNAEFDEEQSEYYVSPGYQINKEEAKKECIKCIEKMVV